MANTRLVNIIVVFILSNSMVEGKRQCSPTWKTKALITGGTFAGTFAGAMLAGPAIGTW